MLRTEGDRLAAERRAFLVADVQELIYGPVLD
jgi:hypothetical protein